MKKPFGNSLCTVCKKRFGNRNSLQKHRVATGHEGENPVSKKIKCS